MKRFLIIFLSLVGLQFLAADFKEDALIKAEDYKATITRDIWGVPHIEGKRDSDVAFGLAYAHAEDDIKNFISSLSLYRAEMGIKEGFNGAITDYLIKVLSVREQVVERYQKDLSLEVRQVIEAYVHGLNYWAALNPDNPYIKEFPITKEDIVVGFSLQNLFFSGVVSAIEKLQKDKELNKIKDKLVPTAINLLLEIYL